MGTDRKKNQKTKIKALLDEGYKPSQIIKLGGYDSSYVYRIVRNLQQKNFVHKKGETTGQGVDKGRSDLHNVHGQNVRFFVKRMGDRYKKNSTSFYAEFVPGVDVKCDGRLIHARTSGLKFVGGSEHKALLNSVDFWKRVGSRLEERLGVLIFKRGHAAFQFLKQEVETRDSVVARDFEERGHKFVVWHTEDDKLRLSADWSDGEPNHEAFHVRDGLSDSITFNAYVNSILDNPQAPTYAELVKVVGALAVETREGAAGLRSLITLFGGSSGSSSINDDEDGLERPFYLG